MWLPGGNDKGKEHKPVHSIDEDLQHQYINKHKMDDFPVFVGSIASVDPRNRILNQSQVEVGQHSCKSPVGQKQIVTMHMSRITRRGSHTESVG